MESVYVGLTAEEIVPYLEQIVNCQYACIIALCAFLVYMGFFHRG